MVNDAVRKQLRDLSQEYAKGGLPQQEYRRRRSLLLDSMSGHSAGGSVRGLGRIGYKRAWLGLGLVSLTILLALALLF